MNLRNKNERSWCNRNLELQWQNALNLIDAQGDHVFTELFDYQIPQTGVLTGAIISIKDLFDVSGYQTRAGSVFLNHQAAQKDAKAVFKLRKAGASFIGHTNMTELAYSGLGLNPHYGTPDNPIISGRIPGGSTSGGAVSVALGIADATLGTDTGGSLRIPAAFCGLTGFKPSQQSVSREGCLPLSDSLDSVGPMAKSVYECETIWRVLSDNQNSTSEIDLTHVRLVVPHNFGITGLDKEIEQGFRNVLDYLVSLGVNIEQRYVPALEDYKAIPIWQFSAYESRNYYGRMYDLTRVPLDPRVASRIARAYSLSPQEFIATQELRSAFIEREQAEEPYTIYLFPTVAICAPKFSDLVSDVDYDRLNLLCLRNTTLANVLNGCSVSLPMAFNGEPMGLMLTAKNGQDEMLLALAKYIESLLSNFT